MEKLSNLTLSENEIDTTMAREFIKKNAVVFPAYGTYVIENRKTRLQTSCAHSNIREELFGWQNKFAELDLTSAAVAGKKLAELIENNIEMFVQLEYLARETAAEDVRNGHVKLICQILRCGDALWNRWPLSDDEENVHLIEFNETTPLYYLGLIAASLFVFPRRPCFIVSSNMIHLCQFFVDLCHDAGLFTVPIIHSDIISDEMLSQKIPAYPVMWGCTGVITERSDLDSAIDVFIHSSVSAPWRLKQIYVQESVFENFQLALRAKVRTEEHHIVLENKTFLIENLTSSPGIPTQAYRTTKELLSLIDTPYLSVWAANSAESNEIALNTSADIVWVNEYGTFDGPPRAAISVYSSLFHPLHYILDFKDEKLNIGPWSKMQIEKRLQIIISALEATADDVCKALLPEIRDKWRPDDLLKVTDTTICFGIQQPIGFILYSRIENEFESVLRILKALVNGNSFVINTSGIPLIDDLARRGVPIGKVNYMKWIPIKNDVQKGIRFPLLMEKLKMIRTNYGTIFAN